MTVNEWSDAYKKNRTAMFEELIRMSNEKGLSLGELNAFLSYAQNELESRVFNLRGCL